MLVGLAMHPKLPNLTKKCVVAELGIPGWDWRACVRTTKSYEFDKREIWTIKFGMTIL